MKALPFRLAAVDCDDTLLAPDKSVSPPNRAALRSLQSAGCRVVLATGRRHSRMPPLYADLGLDDFAVSCQGARVQHVRTGALIHSAIVGADASHEILTEGLARGHTVVLWDERGIYSPSRGRWVEAYISQTGNDCISWVSAETLRGRTFEKIVWVGEALSAPELPVGIVATVPNPWCLEFAARGANKMEGVAALAAAASIRAEEVIAFGDGLNDIALLRWAGRGIAMGHAEEAVRKAADWISPTGDAATAFARSVDLLLGS